MVTKLDKVMEDLEKKEAVLKADIKKASDAAESKINDELIRIDELIVAIRRVSREARSLSLLFTTSQYESL